MSDVRINYSERRPRSKYRYPEQKKAVYLTIKNQQIYSLLNGIFLTQLLENQIIYVNDYPSNALSESNSSPETSSNFIRRSSTVNFFFSSPEMFRMTRPLFIMIRRLP